MDRATLIRAHRASLAERVDALQASAEAARQGTRVDGDHRPASRGERGAVTGQAALQAGFARRLVEVQTALRQLDSLPAGPRSKVGPGALVRIDEEGEGRLLAILPGGAGDRIATDDGPVTVISPASPLARALFGLEEGDVALLERRGEEREVEVVSCG